MAIKAFTFSFKLDAKDLLEYVTERNIGVHVEAYGTAPKKPKELAAPKMLALPAPRNKERPGIQAVIMAFLLKHQEGVKAAVLRQLIVQSGYSAQSYSNQFHQLKNHGLIKNLSKTRRNAVYAPTPKALREAANGQEH